jgi:hypothetical protein
VTAARAPKPSGRNADYSDLREPLYLLPPDTRAASPKAVGWRPLGYLSLTIVWVLLSLIALAVTVLVLPWRLTVDGAGSLGESPGFHGNPVIGAVVVLLLGPVVGAICAVVLCVTIGSALGSATYFCRSLLPSYRGERLTFTSFSQGAEATGPASLFGLRTAFSLIPVRLTRWTKIATVITAQGLVVNVTLWILGFWWGVFYVFTVGWMLWPAQGVAAVVCTIISVVLFAVFVYVVWRNRGTYADVMPAAYRGTPYERSWPNRPRQKAPRTPARRAAPSA